MAVRNDQNKENHSKETRSSEISHQDECISKSQKSQREFLEDFPKIINLQLFRGLQNLGKITLK